MTSLAAQLRVLSGSTTANGGKAADQRKGFNTRYASLLYDPKTAADIDSDTIYNLGLNGLSELREQDERFAPFETSLFGSVAGAMQSFDREGQSAKVNAALDHTLAQFLRVLSPYFLLKPAHKVLEFLLRRYKIHEHNVDAVLECMLPYHETTLFARMLQLTRVDHPRWQWLTTAQKNGAPLARATLVHRCTVDSSVLEFVCDLAKNVVALSRSPLHCKAALGLFTQTVDQVLQQVSKVDDELALRLLPHFLRGLQSDKHHSPDYRAACEMLLARLCSRCVLQRAALDSLLVVMASNLASLNEGDSTAHALAIQLESLVVICQSQSLSILPSKAFLSLAKLPKLSAALSQLTASYAAPGFLAPLVRSLAAHYASDSTVRALTARLVTEVPALKAHLALLLDELLQAYAYTPASASNKQDQASKEVGKDLRDLLHSVNQLYPSELDSMLESAMKKHAQAEEKGKKEEKEKEKESSSSKKGKGKRSKDKDMDIDNDNEAQDRVQRLAVLSLLQSSLQGTRHQFFAEAGTTVFLSLSHPVASVRVGALDQLQKLMDNGGVETSFVSEALLMRLEDEDMEVVARVLRFPALYGILSPALLSERLLVLLDQASNALATGAVVAPSSSNAEIKAQRRHVRAVVLSALQLLSSHLASSSTTTTTTTAVGKDHRLRLLGSLLQLLTVHASHPKLASEVVALVVKQKQVGQMFPMLQGLESVSEQLHQLVSSKSDEKEQEKEKEEKGKGKSKGSKKGDKKANTSDSNNANAKMSGTELAAVNVALAKQIASNLSQDKETDEGLQMLLQVLEQGRGLWMGLLSIYYLLSSLSSSSSSSSSKKANNNSNNKERQITICSAVLSVLAKQWAAVKEKDNNNKNKEKEENKNKSKNQEEESQSQGVEHYALCHPQSFAAFLKCVLLRLVDSAPIASESDLEDPCSPISALLRSLLSFFTVSYGAFEGHVATLFRRCLPSAACVLLMLCPVIASHPYCSIPLPTVVHSLHILHTLISAIPSSGLDLALLVPALCVPLCHASRAVRHAALLVVGALANSVDVLATKQSDSDACAPLLSRLVEWRHEILSDAAYLPSIVTDLLGTGAGLGDAVSEALYTLLMPLPPVSKSHLYAHMTLLNMLSSLPSTPVMSRALSLLTAYLEPLPVSSAASDSALENSSLESRLVAHELSAASMQTKILALLLSRLDEHSISSSRAFDTLLAAMQSNMQLSFQGTEVYVSEMAVGCVTKALFAKLSHKQQERIFHLLSSLSLEAAPSVSTASQNALKAIHLSSDFLLAKLHAHQPKMLLATLELLQFKTRGLMQPMKLVAALFACLAKLMMTSSSSSSGSSSGAGHVAGASGDMGGDDAEYAKQLILSALNRLLSQYLSQHGALNQQKKQKQEKEKKRESKKGGKKKEEKEKEKEKEEESGDDELQSGDLHVESVVACILAVVPSSESASASISAAVAVAGALHDGVGVDEEEDEDGDVAMAMMKASKASAVAVDNTRNHALQLLATIASLAPSLVLAHVVPVLTALGRAQAIKAQAEHALRQVTPQMEDPKLKKQQKLKHKQQHGKHALPVPVSSSEVVVVLEDSADDEHDSYTESLIQQTIETVIPPMLSVNVNVQSEGKSESKSESEGETLPVAELLRSFILACISPSPASTSASSPSSSSSSSSSSSASSTPSLLLLDGRRLRLLTSLLSTLSPASYLHAALAILLAQAVLLPSTSSSTSTSTSTSASSSVSVSSSSSAAASSAVPSIVQSSLEQFAHNLCCKFSAHDQVVALGKLLDLADAFVQPDSKQSYLPRDLFNQQQASIWRESLLRFLGEHFLQHKLLNQLIDLTPEQEDKLQSEYLVLFQALFIRVRRLSEAEAKAIAKVKAEDEKQESKEEKTGSKKKPTAGASAPSSAQLELSAIQTCLSLVHQALDNLNGLLSIKGFVSVVQQLLSHSESAVRRRALSLLNDKVIATKDEVDEEDVALFTSMLPSLELLISGKRDSKNKSADASVSESVEDEIAANQQAALLSVEVMAKCLASVESQSAAFIALTPAVIQAAQHPNAHVASSGLLCLGSLVAGLGPRLLPHLPALVAALLAALNKALTKPESSGKRKASSSSASASVDSLVVLQLSGLTVVLGLCEGLSRFLSPYLPKLVDCLLSPYFATTQSSSLQHEVTEIQHLLSRLTTTLSLSLPARQTLPPMLACFNKAIAYGQKSLLRLLSMVGQVCSKLSKEDVAEQHKPLFKFFLAAFDIRRLHGAKMSGLDEVDGAAIDAFMTLLLKLSEEQLKGLFLLALQWVKTSPQSAGDMDPSRALVFFRLIDQLISKLKRLFVPYFGYLLELCVTLMKSAPEIEEEEEEEESDEEEEEEKQSSKKRRQNKGAAKKKKTAKTSSVSPAVRLAHESHIKATEYVLVSLTKCLVYDTESFMGKEQFDRLVPALVDQFSIAFDERSLDEYQTFTADKLVPCLAQMVETMNNYTLWQPLNNLVLEQTRSPHAAVRLAALSLLSQCFARMREQYLVLLPATMQYIHELMEDQDIEVEQKCQQLIKQIEEISGESLDKYLSA